MTNLLKSSLALAGLASLALVAPIAANAQAMLTNAGFNTNSLPRNDDGSYGTFAIGFGINFYGVNTSSLYVNNNGNVTFDGPLSTYTPFSLSTTNRQMLAPFFADVDTRNGGSNVVKFGNDTVGGRPAFGVNWGDAGGGLGVGYYSGLINHMNNFQLVMVDRSDVAAGDFDFYFNYDKIDWETGQASGGNGQGRGGSSARAGWSNGSTNTYEIAGSAINGALLDGGPNALISSSNIGVAGRFCFAVRSGVVSAPGTVPEPGTVALLVGMGVSGLSLLRRRRNK